MNYSDRQAGTATLHTRHLNKASSTRTLPHMPWLAAPCCLGPAGGKAEGSVASCGYRLAFARARPQPTGHGPASTQEEANERARGRRMQLAAWCMRGADDTAARVRALPGAAFNARAATDGLEQGLCSATGASGTYCTLQPPVNHVRSRAWRVATGDPAGAAGH
jgi:hypothetical protein